MSHPSVHARHTPDKPACIMAGSGEVMTYRQLDERSNRAAHLLRQRGVQAGAHIAIFMHNSVQFMEVIWAAQRCGLFFTTVSTHLTAAEVAYILTDCDATVLITDGQLASVAAAACAEVPALALKLVAADGEYPGFEPYASLCAAMPATPIADECGGVEMLYSSGTTGKPKGIAIEFVEQGIDSIPRALQALISIFSINADTVYLSPAPLYHAAPLRFNMLTHFQGGTSIIMEKFDAALALQLISRYRVTHSQWVPIMFSRLLALPAETRARADVSSMQFAIHAAAPCPVHVKQDMISWWGQILHEYYGSTEAIGITVIDTPQWLAHRGSVGRAIVGKPRIVDEDSGRELASGEIGVLYFSDGPGFEYHKDPEKTAAARNPAGWYTCGDIGYVDRDGYVYLTDRKAFTIISGGVNIYPKEAEDVLSQHPAVADVAVIGVPDEEFGEAVKAVVELRAPQMATPAMAEELLRFCRDRLSHIKCPRSLDFIDTLPRYDNGKLYKQALVQRYRTTLPH
jgi:acyl-CoA synthetase (AMP-forming)/AMP-acid ligase II